MCRPPHLDESYSTMDALGGLGRAGWIGIGVHLSGARKTVARVLSFSVETSQIRPSLTVVFLCIAALGIREPSVGEGPSRLEGYRRKRGFIFERRVIKFWFGRRGNGEVDHPFKSLQRGAGQRQGVP